MDNKFFIQCLEDYVRKDYESFIKFMEDKGFSFDDVNSFDFDSYTDIEELEVNLKNETNSLENTIEGLENEINDLEYKIDALESEVSDRENKIDDLEDTLRKLNVIY